jgi:hypothetical protein
VANRPTLANTNADAITLASGDTVKGVNIDPNGTGGGISGVAGVASGTISDVKVTDTGTNATQAGLELNGTSGTFNVSNLTIDESAASNTAPGVLLNNAGTVNFASTGTISIKTNGGKALDATGTAMGAASVFDSITTSNGSAGAISMSNTTGTTTFDDLSLTTSGGTAFLLNNAGAVGVDGSLNSDTISATSGPAVDVTGGSNGTQSLAFDNVSSSTSGGKGINLSALGAGTFSATGGSLVGFTGTAFDVNGSSSGNIGYAGQINDGAGNSANVSGRTGGTVTLSGTITDGADAAGGVTLSGNSGGSTVFSGANDTFNTGGSNAVTMGTSPSHTLSFTGGGLSLTSTTGSDVAATGSGTLNVTGTGNTASSTTGTAITITSTTVGASGVTFQSVASNGAVDGIVLNTTGSAGLFKVSGNGGTCSSVATCTGGAIQNSTDAGMTLTGVGGGVSLAAMSVNNGADDGIRASNVQGGIALSNDRIATNGTPNPANPVQNGLDYTNVTGSSSLTNSTITGSAVDNAEIINNVAGTTSTWSITGSTISSNSSVTGAEGIEFRPDSTATVNVTVNSDTFTANADSAFQMAVSGGNPTFNLHFDNSSVTGGNARMTPAQPGVVIAPINGTQSKVEFNNDTFSNVLGHALTLNPLPATTATASFDATVTNSTFGVVGTPNSGSGQFAAALQLRPNGEGDARYLVKGNTFQNWGNENNAINLISGEGDVNNIVQHEDVTITGNTFTEPTAPDAQAINVDVNEVSTATEDVCLDIGGAGTLSNAFNLTTPNAGIFGIELDTRGAATAKLELPGFTTGGDPQAYINGRNTGNPVVVVVDNNPVGKVGGCTQPTLPT